MKIVIYISGELEFAEAVCVWLANVARIKQHAADAKKPSL